MSGPRGIGLRVMFLALSLIGHKRSTDREFLHAASFKPMFYFMGHRKSKRTSKQAPTQQHSSNPHQHLVVAARAVVRHQHADELARTQSRDTRAHPAIRAANTSSDIGEFEDFMVSLHKLCSKLENYVESSPVKLS
jgi:hypothetical protein